MNRIVGLETEYGCLTSDPSGPPSAVGRVRNWIFDRSRFGLLTCISAIGTNPPAMAVFFSTADAPTWTWATWNIARLNASPSTDSCYDCAGDAILCQAVKDLRLHEQVEFHSE